MGALLSKAQYGRDTDGNDYSPITCQLPVYCGCCMPIYPCLLPAINDEHIKKPKVLSTKGLSKDEKKLWKALVAGNAAKATQYLEHTNPKKKLDIPDIGAVRINGDSNLLIGIASVDHSAFSVDSAKFLIERQIDINFVRVGTKENVLMAALETFGGLLPVTACFCCTLFREDIRKQNCLELSVFLVDRGIDLSYSGTGLTAVLKALNIFVNEAESQADLSVKQGCCEVAVSHEGFHPMASAWDFAVKTCEKMQDIDFFSEKSDHLVHRLIQLATQHQRHGLSLRDVRNAVDLLYSILCNKSFNLKTQDDNGKGDNVLLALLAAWAQLPSDLLTDESNTFGAVIGMVLSKDFGLNFSSSKDGTNALHRSVDVIHQLGQNISCVSVVRNLADIATTAVGLGIDINYTPQKYENIFFRCLNEAVQVTDVAAAITLVELCLDLLQRGVELGSDSKVDPSVLFFILDKMLEVDHSNLFDKFILLIHALITQCNTDLNHKGSVKDLPAAQTPAVLFMRRQCTLGAIGKSGTNAQIYLQTAELVLSMPKVDVNLPSDDKVSPLFYATLKFLQTGASEWQSLMEKICQRDDIKLDAAVAKISAGDAATLGLLYPANMQPAKSSQLNINLFDVPQVSLLGLVTKALVMGLDEIRALDQDVKESSAVLASKADQLKVKAAEVDHLQRRTDGLFKEKMDSWEKLDGLSKEASSLQSVLDELKRQLDVASSEQTQGNQVVPDQSHLRSEISALEPKVAAARRLMLAAQNDHTAKQAAYDEVKGELDAAQTQKSQLTVEHEELQAAADLCKFNRAEFGNSLLAAGSDTLSRLRIVLRTLVHSGADITKPIDKIGQSPIVYLITHISGDWVGSYSGLLESTESAVKILLEDGVKNRLPESQVGKALLSLFMQYGRVRLPVPAAPDDTCWAKLCVALLDHTETARNYKDTAAEDVTPLLELLRVSSRMDGTDRHTASDIVCIHLIRTLVGAFPENTGVDSNTQADMLNSYLTRTSPGALGYGVLHFMLQSHLRGFWQLNSLRDLLVDFLQLGLDASAPMHLNTDPALGIRPSHLQYFFALCGANSSPNRKGLSFAARADIIAIMRAFFASYMDQEGVEPEDFSPNMLGKHSEAYGYEFYLWWLALKDQRLSCKDVIELLTVLMESGMDGNAEVSFTEAQVRSCFRKSAHAWPRRGAVLSMLMLSVEFLQQLPLESLGLKVREESPSTELFRVLMLTENTKVAWPSTPVIVSKAEGVNTVLHYIFELVIRLYCWPVNGGFTSGWHEAASHMISTFVTEGGFCGIHDNKDLPRSDANFLKYMRLKAVLEVMAIVVTESNLRTTSVVHKDITFPQLLKRVSELHGLDSLQGITPADSKEHLLAAAALHPLEAILLGALRPIQAGCSEGEAAVRFQLARHMAYYLMDAEAAGGSGPALSFKERQDRLEHILFREVYENNKLTHLEPVKTVSGNDYVRCVPPHLLAWLLTEMGVYDPIMANPWEARKLDMEAVIEESPLLELAKILLEGGASADATVYQEAGIKNNSGPRSGKGRTKRKPKNSTASSLLADKLMDMSKTMGEAPLIILAFDQLVDNKVAASALAAMVELLLEYHANPTALSQNHTSLLMHVVKFGLSRDAIEPFISGQGVPEEKEEKADEEIEHITNILCTLNSNQFVRKRPGYVNLRNRESKTAFLLGAEALVKNKRPLPSQVMIINQLMKMEACPVLKDKKGGDAANVILAKCKDRDIKDVMNKAADRYERYFDQALGGNDQPFLETMIAHSAIDVTSRIKNGDSIIVWAAKNGRADLVEAILDADAGQQIFADERNFVQHGLSVLHLAAQAGEDSTHHDTVMQLITHPLCRSIETYGGKPLKAMRCHGKTTREMLLEPEYDDKATQMRKLFSPDKESLEKLLREGKGAGLVASTLQEILDRHMIDLAGANSEDGGSALEEFESKSSQAPVESQISVAEMLGTRYEGMGGLLTQAAKLGDKRLLEVVLKWCSLLESNITAHLPEDHPLVEEQKKYLGQGIWEASPDRRSSRKSLPMLGADRHCITTEEGLRSWCEGQSFPINRLEDLDHDPSNLFMTVVLNPKGEKIGCFRESTLMVAEEFDVDKASIEKCAQSAFGQENDTKECYRLERCVVNRCILDCDKDGLTALDHAVKHFGHNASNNDTIRLLCGHGAVPSLDHDEASTFYRNASNYVQNLLGKKSSMSDDSDDRRPTGHGQPSAVEQVPHLDAKGPIKHHLFMSHAQAISQTAVFEIVRNFEDLTNGAINIWTDQRKNATWDSMYQGIHAAQKVLVYLAHAEMKDGRLNDARQYYKDVTSNRQESIEEWLSRTRPGWGYRKDDDGTTYYNHPATLWRPWCLFEFACSLGVGAGAPSGEDKTPKTIIFVAEGDSRQGGSGVGYRGEAKAQARPYEAQLRELKAVMEEEKNKLTGQKDTRLSNQDIISVADKLLKLFEEDYDLFEWSRDPFLQPAIAKKLLQLRVFPRISSPSGADASGIDALDTNPTGGEPATIGLAGATAGPDGATAGPGPEAGAADGVNGPGPAAGAADGVNGPGPEAGAADGVKGPGPEAGAADGVKGPGPEAGAADGVKGPGPEARAADGVKGPGPEARAADGVKGTGPEARAADGVKGPGPEARAADGVKGPGPEARAADGVKGPGPEAGAADGVKGPGPEARAADGVKRPGPEARAADGVKGPGPEARAADGVKGPGPEAGAADGVVGPGPEARAADGVKGPGPEAGAADGVVGPGPEARAADGVKGPGPEAGAADGVVGPGPLPDGEDDTSPARDSAQGPDTPEK